MTRRLRWIAAGLGAVALAAGAVALRPKAEGDKPELLVLTSLPLLFGEQFALDAPPRAAAEALEKHYRLAPIAIADAPSLKGHRLLLMAHPRAQTAEALVDLDAWVRGGGRVLLLADPRLTFESKRPLGDLLRPSPSFPDTGLLGHWGLRLDAPDPTATGEAASWGELVATGPGCTVATDKRSATCRLGKGEARVVADADFVMSENPADFAAMTDALDALARR